MFPYRDILLFRIMFLYKYESSITFLQVDIAVADALLSIPLPVSATYITRVVTWI